MSAISPSQEPVAWGAVVTAALGVVVVFLPRFGIHLTGDEYTALAALAAAIVPLVVGLLVRQNVVPTAAAPVVAALPATPSV